jgi:hypothetical protein
MTTQDALDFIQDAATVTYGGVLTVPAGIVLDVSGWYVTLALDVGPYGFNGGSMDLPTALRTIVAGRADELPDGALRDRGLTLLAG